VKLGGKDACLRAIEKARAKSEKSEEAEEGSNQRAASKPGAETKKRKGFFNWLFGR
jgi:hypothetical protein